MIETRLDRIGIVMMSAVGDAVHVLPVINALKRHNPSSHITWILQPGPATLVRGHPQVDEILEFHRSRGYKAFSEIRKKLAARPFDLVLNLQVYLKAGIVTSFTRAPVKLGFDKARARDANWMFTTHRIAPHLVGQHVQDQYFEFLSALGIDPEPVAWNLGPWEDERGWQREFYSTFDRPAVALVIATSKAEKDWAPDRWAAVADALYHDFGMQPVLVGGRSPREVAAEAEILAKAHHTPVSALGSGLRRLVSIMDGAAFVIAPDTGPLHISVALNKPVISLIGYTNPKRTGPWRRFQDLIIDAYGDPGEDYPINMDHRSGRMPRITVDDVLTKVELCRERYLGAAAK